MKWLSRQVLSAVFLALGFLLSLSVVTPVSAQVSIGDSLEDITVNNQAVAAGQRKLVFSGELENTGDSTALGETFTFVFNEDPAEDLDPADNNVDTLIVDLDGTERHIDVDGSSPPYRAVFSQTIPPVRSLDVSIVMLDNPEHNNVFDLQLSVIRANQQGSNQDAFFTDIIKSNNITVKSLITPYSKLGDAIEGVDDQTVPDLLAAESDSIPLIYLDFAGQNPGDTLGFDQIEFRIRELLEELIPDGPSGTEFGDFSQIAIVRSTEPVYGQGEAVELGTADLPTTPADSWVFDVTPSDEDANFLETTEESSYYVTIRTNQGWGYNAEEELGIPSDQFFGYGEAWDAWIDTGAIQLTNGISNNDLGKTTIEVTNVKSHGFDDLNGYIPIMAKYYGQPTVLQNDNVGLDFHPTPLFSFNAIGTANENGIQTSLEAIRIEFPSYSTSETPKELLRSLKASKFSGLSIWYNRPGLNSFGQEDTLLELSPENSSWISDTVVRLELQTGFDLPSPSEFDPGLEPLEEDRGISTDTGTIYVAGLMSLTGNRPDTFIANIRLGDIEFDRGVSTPDPDVTTFSPAVQPPRADTEISPRTTAGAMTAQQVTAEFSHLTSDNQQVGAPSGPTPIIGINARDHADHAGQSEGYLGRVELTFEEQSDTNNFTASDLKPLSNDRESGIAIFRDDDDDPDNSNGQFDPQIDNLVPIDLDNVETQKSAPTGLGTETPLVRLILDLASDTMPYRVPPNDESPEHEGPDFFITVNISDNADNLDSFKAVIGNPAIDDFVFPRISFYDGPPVTLLNAISEFFPQRDASAADRFYSDRVEVNTITSFNINPLAVSGPTVDVSGQRIKLFGLSVADGSNGDQTLDEVITTFNWSDTGANRSDSTHIRELTDDDRSGLALYRDNGDGEFNYETDQFINVVNPTWTDYSETSTVSLVTDTTVEIPNSDVGGLDDFYVVARASSQIDIGDTFSASIRGGDVRFSVENSPQDEAGTTPVITASLPILINNRVEAPLEQYDRPNVPIDMLGINTADLGPNDENLNSVTVELDGIGNLNRSWLRELSRNENSGIGIWKDANDNGSFEPSQDNFLVPDYKPSYNSQDEVELSFVNSSQDTSIPDTFDGQDDFFVVIRLSDKISHGNDLRVRIPSEGIETTQFTSSGVGQSNPIVFGSGNVALPTFTDTELVSDQLRVELVVSNQDTVALHLALGNQVDALTPSQYEKVRTLQPNQPDGNVYSANDINVDISSETIGLVARAFNDTGPTAYTDPEIVLRRSIAGINLEGRNNAALADALAASEDFGIVVFGQKGGSNANPSDPAFDPTNGETLKVIPPQNQTVTMEVFNLEQQRVFRTSTSVPGVPAEWRGQGLDVNVVNNGVYIVRVTSGSKEKTFPVMVVK
jgi:hypothetical protein